MKLKREEFTRDEILTQLDKLEANKAFSRSKINLRLLKFLVESTLNGDDIKEVTIGTEFFGVNYDPIKSDNKVRVYIYHLRKKLEEYYSSAASPDEIIFNITKGQYRVKFERYQKPKAEKSSKNKVLLSAGGVFLFGILLLIGIQEKAGDFWITLMQNELPTTVIFGDYFTIEGPIQTGRKGIVRDYEINSEEDLQTFIDQNPDKEAMADFQASRHHYFNWGAPYCSKTITQFWSQYEYPFDIIQVSEWSISQIENENLVYFGQSKSMGVLKKILKENFPQYSFKSQRLNRRDRITNEDVLYNDYVTKEGKIIDYTVVAKIEMPAGNELRFFLSDQDCGIISTLNYFTNSDSVAAFYERYQLSKEQNFLALFKVTGWKRKSYDMEFILLDKK
ncbi:helix-turn-helix domain-containing protein [Flammeovirga sp. EKP202]|uniref:helix-turn-helix domain-containing protein n=1 Tax=Flammeovirga sp. EKP202 TaxID=2770592 RepID=UPI00165F8C25|nr:helix-turn-helix domain-containing protein [Flammeovirga sp. EKP202]MBD0403016.1 winged helix-turn-helix domain-containing protein [Flammeovirga sp. EKP202]